MPKRIFSGAQPTGNVHLGNYLGALRNWVALQHEYESIYCIVNLHAITLPQDPKALAEKTRELARIYLAVGIDPKVSTVFIQSDVSEHAELTCTVQLDPWFRLTAAAGYQVARGAALTLDCTDAVAPDPASVAIKAATGTPPGPMPTLTTTVTTVVVTVPAGTPPGFYEVTAAATGAPDHQARRTIAIT